MRATHIHVHKYSVSFHACAHTHTHMFKVTLPFHMQVMSLACLAHLTPHKNAAYPIPMHQGIMKWSSPAERTQLLPPLPFCSCCSTTRLASCCSLEPLPALQMPRPAAAVAAPCLPDHAGCPPRASSSPPRPPTAPWQPASLAPRAAWPFHAAYGTHGQVGSYERAHFNRHTRQRLWRGHTKARSATTLA